MYLLYGAGRAVAMHVDMGTGGRGAERGRRTNARLAARRPRHTSERILGQCMRWVYADGRYGRSCRRAHVCDVRLCSARSAVYLVCPSRVRRRRSPIYLRGHTPTLTQAHAYSLNPEFWVRLFPLPLTTVPVTPSPPPMYPLTRSRLGVHAARLHIYHVASLRYKCLLSTQVARERRIAGTRRATPPPRGISILPESSDPALLI